MRPRFEAPASAQAWHEILRRVDLSEEEYPALTELRAWSQRHDGSFLKLLPGGHTLLPLKLIGDVWDAPRVLAAIRFRHDEHIDITLGAFNPGILR